MKTICVAVLTVLALTVTRKSACASGHGPVFGAATPTLGRDGWSIDQVLAVRDGDDGSREHMLRTMISYGITENLQVSGSVPIALGGGDLASARAMSTMSGGHEFETLLGYRFQRRTLGIGGRQESTLYLGGSVPLQSRIDDVAIGPSVYLGGATGYASRAHYAWVGANVQHFTERSGDQIGDSRMFSAVYGYRPPALRTETGKPDLRFFVEMTAEHRQSDYHAGINMANGARTVFVGPTALLLHKAFGISGGVLFPLYERVDQNRVAERFRATVNVTYFFWLR
jgi:hypothetical protein